MSEDHIDVKVSHFSVSSLDSNLISRSESNETHCNHSNNLDLGTAAYGTVANVPAKFKGSFAVGDKVGVTVTRSNCSNCRQCAQGR